MDNINQAIEYVNTVPFAIAAFEGYRPLQVSNSLLDLKESGLFVHKTNNSFAYIVLPENIISERTASDLINNIRTPATFRKKIFLATQQSILLIGAGQMAYNIPTEDYYPVPGRILAKQTFTTENGVQIKEIAREGRE